MVYSCQSLIGIWSAKFWKDVLDLRQNECLGIASVITFASSDIEGPDSEHNIFFLHKNALFLRKVKYPT